MAYGVLIESMIQAKNIDALNRSVKAEIDVDGGNLIALTAPTVKGEDRWTASAPATGALGGLWIAYNPSVKYTEVNGKMYAGLSADPRDYTNIKNHTFDAFQKYNYSVEFKYVEAENISFEVIKNVFGNKPNTLYFIKLPFNFFRLKSNITKLLNIIEAKTIKYFVFLVPYDDIINKTTKIQEFKNLGFKIGVYNMKEAETKSIKLKGIIDYLYLRPSEVSNYSEIIKFAKSIDTIIIENEQNDYKIYK